MGAIIRILDGPCGPHRLATRQSMGKRTISALTPHHAQAQVPGRRPNVEAKIWRRWTGQGRLGRQDGIISIAPAWMDFFEFYPAITHLSLY